MPTVTVNGANGQVFPVTYTTNDAFDDAKRLANAINTIVARSGVSTQVLTSAGATTPPSGGLAGELAVTNNGSSPFQVSQGADQIVVVVAGDGNNILGTETGTGGSAFFRTASGNDTIQAVRGSNTVEAGLGQNFVGTGTANDLIVIEGSDVVVGDTVPGGGGSDTIIATTGNDLAFGFSSNLFFASFGGTGSTVVGGSGSDTMFSGSAGGVFFAGTGGGSSLVGGSGTVTLVGGGNADVLFASDTGGGPTAPGSSYLVAGMGNETLNGAYDARGIVEYAGNNTVFNGVKVQANTVVFGGAGNDTIFAGSGNATLISGGGVDSFNFTNGSAGGYNLIGGFTSADRIHLAGYSSPAGASAAAAGVGLNGIADVAILGGSTQITLSDNTRIVLSNFTGLIGQNFS